MREWSVEIFIANQHDGSQVPASTVYDKALFKLHPSFGPREKQSKPVPP